MCVCVCVCVCVDINYTKVLIAKHDQNIMSMIERDVVKNGLSSFFNQGFNYFHTLYFYWKESKWCDGFSAQMWPWRKRVRTPVTFRLISLGKAWTFLIPLPISWIGPLLFFFEDSFVIIYPTKFDMPLNKGTTLKLISLLSNKKAVLLYFILATHIHAEICIYACVCIYIYVFIHTHSCMYIIFCWSYERNK